MNESNLNHKPENGTERNDTSLPSPGTGSRKIIDLTKAGTKLWRSKKVFIKVWSVVFVLSCIWILPQPRYYTCDVSLAPESTESALSGGGLSSIASSFGINLGAINNQDAIYPLLYPDLFESPEFIVSLMDIHVRTQDDKVDTDYYTYLRKHQKQNILTRPFNQAMRWLRNQFSEKKGKASGTPDKLDPFQMSEDDYMLFQEVMKNILCAHDKKTDVITITVKDQDPLICASMADSVMRRLQDFIIRYRTSKARLDVSYYQHLADSTKLEYDKSAEKYSKYCDSHKDIILQSSIQQRDEMEMDMSLKWNTYSAMLTQLQAMKAKVQERTPAFTTLKSSTVPIKPAGPKRMIFVLGMLIIATVITSLWLLRKDLFS